MISAEECLPQEMQSPDNKFDEPIINLDIAQRKLAKSPNRGSFMKKKRDFEGLDMAKTKKISAASSASKETLHLSLQVASMSRQYNSAVKAG